MTEQTLPFLDCGTDGEFESCVILGWPTGRFSTGGCRQRGPRKWIWLHSRIQYYWSLILKPTWLKPSLTHFCSFFLCASIYSSIGFVPVFPNFLPKILHLPTSWSSSNALSKPFMSSRCPRWNWNKRMTQCIETVVYLVHCHVIHKECSKSIIYLYFLILQFN